MVAATAICQHAQPKHYRTMRTRDQREWHTYEMGWDRSSDGSYCLDDVGKRKHPPARLAAARLAGRVGCGHRRSLGRVSVRVRGRKRGGRRRLGLGLAPRTIISPTRTKTPAAPILVKKFGLIAYELTRVTCTREAIYSSRERGQWLGLPNLVSRDQSKERKRSRGPPLHERVHLGT